MLINQKWLLHMHKIRSAILSGDGLQAYTPLAAKKPVPRKPEVEPSLIWKAIPREQPRITDHRSEDRLIGGVESVTLRIRDEQATVKVINVSNRGLMIEADADVVIGEELGIQLQDGSWTKCVVRWRRGDRIGLGFREEDLLD